MNVIGFIALQEKFEDIARSLVETAREMGHPAYKSLPKKDFVALDYITTDENIEGNVLISVYASYCGDTEHFELSVPSYVFDDPSQLGALVEFEKEKDEISKIAADTITKENQYTVDGRRKMYEVLKKEFGNE